MIKTLSNLYRGGLRVLKRDDNRGGKEQKVPAMMERTLFDNQAIF
jgi:hypothetical protein